MEVVGVTCYRNNFGATFMCKTADFANFVL